MSKTISDAHLDLAYRLGESAVPTDTTELARRLNWFKTAIDIVCSGDQPLWFLKTKAFDVTIANQQDYTVPSGLRQFIQVKVDGYKYKKMAFEDVYEKYELPNSIVPILPAYLARAFYYRYDKFYLIPIPSAAPTSLSVTIAESSGTATATTASAHGYKRGDVVVFAGATPAAYNTSFTILTVPSTTTFTFAITASTGAATGTVTVYKKNIEIEYFAEPTEPTASTSSIVVPDGYIDILVSYAEGRYWSYAHKRGKSADAFVEFETRHKALKEEDFRRHFGED